jgi:hypothetical protein
MVGFAEFTIGLAKGGTRWLNPPYVLAPAPLHQRLGSNAVNSPFPLKDTQAPARRACPTPGVL